MRSPARAVEMAGCASQRASTHVRHEHIDGVPAQRRVPIGMLSETLLSFGERHFLGRAHAGSALAVRLSSFFRIIASQLVARSSRVDLARFESLGIAMDWAQPRGARELA